MINRFQKSETEDNWNSFPLRTWWCHLRNHQDSNKSSENLNL